jgi:isopenicillin N synthase-like dioxygenase
MGDALGEQEIFAELQKDNYWVLRVIGYPPLPESFDTTQGISCGAHTDYGCLTFLLADDFPGALQGGQGF